MSTFSFRPYISSDYNFVYDVKKISYQKYVEENYGAWEDEVQQKMFSDFMSQEHGNIKIIVVGGIDAGFVNGKVVSKVYEQGNICLLPEFQNRGIGTKILKDVISQNSSLEIRLKVFRHNPAKRLYERLGFEVYGETNSHFLMRRMPN